MNSPQISAVTDRAKKGTSRLEMGLPIKYRLPGEDVWRDGWLESISPADVVFRGDNAAEVDTMLDIRLLLPRVHGAERGAMIASKAKVTQSWVVPTGTEHGFIAAALTHPRLLRSKRAGGWK